MTQHDRGLSLASLLLRALLVSYTLSLLMTSSSAQISSSTGNPSSVVLAKILQDSKQITELIRLLTQHRALQEGGQEGLLKGEEQKREAAWDMDYGWGGGRFGKRMDSLGIAGRFGRSVDKRKDHPKA